MTIAAGFVNENGVLLCADTLRANEFLSTYQSKIIPVSFPDGEALFCFSGEIKFAESAIQQCEASLKRHNRALRPLSEIAEAIRRVWARAFRDAHHRSDLSFDQIIAAVHSERDARVGLFCSSNQSFAESTSGFECIGAGDIVTRYVLDASPGEPQIPQRRAFEAAVRALALVKRFMSSQIGGNLTAVNLTHIGNAQVYGHMDISRVAMLAEEFEDCMRPLASVYVQTMVEAETAPVTALESALGNFTRQVCEMHESFAAIFSAPDLFPRELEGLRNALKREALLVR
jgi:hypothetical protein